MPARQVDRDDEPALGRRLAREGAAVVVADLHRQAGRPLERRDDGGEPSTADDDVVEDVAQVAGPLPALAHRPQGLVRRPQLGGCGALAVEQVGRAQGERGVGGQPGEQLDVAVAEGPCPAVRGEQDPEGVVADDERHPEDAAELLAQRRRVGALSVREAGVLEVALARQRAPGREDLAAEALPRLELDAAHRRAHRPVDDLDPQPVGAQQHDVRDVDAEQPAGLPGHLVEHLAGVVEGGEPAGQVIEDGELVGATAQLGDRLRDVVVCFTHGAHPHACARPRPRVRRRPSRG